MEQEIASLRSYINEIRFLVDRSLAYVGEGALRSGRNKRRTKKSTPVSTS